MTVEQKESKNVETDDDLSQIEIPLAIDKDLEEIFNKICYDVRQDTDEHRFHNEPDQVRNYGVELVSEIKRRKQAGDLTEDEYTYCLEAAREIMGMEMIYFQNEYQTLRDGGVDDSMI